MAKNNTVHKKLEIARKELLDLGLRNPLLNYRITKARGLELSGELPADVFNILVNLKHKMTFDESLQRDEAERTDSGKAISLDKPENSPEREIVTFPPAVGKHGDSKLQTNYSRKQLEQRLLNTYHSARTYIEEQGVNVLYIAFGMLHWFESENSTELRRAPLILAPVQLERISAKDRFSIAYTEDEIGPNISLAAKIKSDFGLDLPDFPEDTELNLDEYFLQVQFAVNGLKGWTVDANSIVIGFFSFGKFLMYRDLDSTVWPDYTALDEHAILAALLDGGFKEADSSITEDELLDEVLPLPETKHVLDADSSQMLAVMDVKQGRNLVIQGPPGTGKSQTITNMIAEAIGEGKKVLFVSEKMAALEVVKRRLDTVGLGVACLELHSHKTNKKLLLRELAATLELGKPIYRDNGSLEMLEELRQRLNNYCIAVNTQVGNSEVTPYQAMGELLRYGKDYPVIGFNTMEQWSAAEYFKREAMVQELEQWIKANGLLAKHPFWGSKKKVVLPTEIKDIREAASKVGDIAEKLIDLLKSGAASLHFPLPLNTQNTLEVISVLKLVCEAPKLEGVNLHSEHWLDKIPQIQMSVAAGLSYNTVHESYDAVLISEAWKQDVLQTRQILMSYKAKWWKLLSGEYRRAKRAALGWLSNPGRKSVSLTELADAILESQRSKEIMQKFKPLVMELFPSYWNEEHTDWGKVASVTEWMNGTLRELKNGSLPAWLSALLEMGFEKDQLKSFIIDLEHQESEYTRALLVIKELLELDVTISNGRVLRLSEADYQQVKEIVSQWAVYTPRLQEIAAYNHLESACLQEGLEPLIKFAQDWADAAENLVDAFRWNWFQAISTSAFYDRDALSAFESSRHEQAVRKFVELDLQFIKTNRIRLAEGHWAKLPQYEAGGQLGVLRRELEKKSRHLPIRQLMAKAGQAIQAIKPVFMMGPLSISTYLEPGGLTFDLVIFDEASQVKPVDAFGAIVRAKQAVVVGDSKQMPPTDLFNSFLNKEDEEDEDNYVADVESILGLFVGQGAPQRMLRWHYRSRHESLITVSNHEFYDNKLVIFPSPDADKQTSGLKYHYLPHTFYDRGRTRTNKLEAAEVAEAVIRHARMHPDLTLGVAAFSIVQMQAIMDELEMLRRINPDTEAFFSAHEHEPFFVKNLENVQGDERDVIYISIGYGKTSDGYLAMEFGVNREGGERRLNVLITRARIRCEVFTNLRSDDIDLNRSNAKGVKVLKTFLKYAESGNLDIPVVTGRGMDSPFEEAVHSALANAGYQVETQIGSGGFFIDLAVTDPDLPGRFLLGIECDGATYHSARSARDRDRLRQEVLEGLGWRIHRIWSTDWFRHPERELKRVITAIEEARIHFKTEQNKPILIDQLILPPEIKRVESQSVSLPINELYQIATLKINLGGKEFHTLPVALVASWVHEVVIVESPVHISEVVKRVCDALGIKRAGSRIQQVFEKAVNALPDITRKGDFLWTKQMEVPPVRNRSSLTINKKIDYIAPEEKEEAIFRVVHNSFGCDEESLMYAVCQGFGFNRLNEEMRIQFHEIINSMIESKRLTQKNGLVNIS